MIDSTKAERAPAAGVKGVRQDLERKEVRSQGYMTTEFR